MRNVILASEQKAKQYLTVYGNKRNRVLAGKNCPIRKNKLKIGSDLYIQPLKMAKYLSVTETCHLSVTENLKPFYKKTIFRKDT